MKRSYWLEDIRSELTPAASLRGTAEADVAIIGGGYVGLWTALTLLEHAPDTKVVVIEKDICGGGASGRNGGMALSWWAKITSLVKVCGKEEAVRLARASVNAIGDIDSFCQQHKIDAHFHQKGWFWTATTEAQVGAWQGVLDMCEQLGETIFQEVSADEIRHRLGSPTVLAGVFDPNAATVQPARLVRGLRKVALERGVQIYENTAVTDFDRRTPVTLKTPDGKVIAHRVVIANNAWASSVPELKNLIVPVTSTLIATAPIAERLETMGWTGHESATDAQLMVDYYRTTNDNRIVFGKGTGGLGYGASIGKRFDFDERDNSATRFDFHRTFPSLKDVAIEHSWSGPIDRSYDSLPMFGALSGAPHIVYGIGWSGNGVAPSRIGGKVLASLTLGLNDEWSRCGLVDRLVKTFPPEPVRILGGAMVRRAVIRKERSEAFGHRPGALDRMLVKLAPSGLGDKSK